MSQASAVRKLNVAPSELGHYEHYVKVMDKRKNVFDKYIYDLKLRKTAEKKICDREFWQVPQLGYENDLYRKLHELVPKCKRIKKDILHKI